MLPMAPPRGRERRSAARSRPRRWGCPGCRGSGGRGFARSGSGLVYLDVVGVEVVPVPVVPVFGSLDCLQLGTTYCLRQSVLAFHFFLKSLTNLVSVACCCCAASCVLIDADAWERLCWLPGVMCVTFNK